MSLKNKAIELKESLLEFNSNKTVEKADTVYGKSISLLSKIFLESPENEKILNIKSVKGSESGLNCLELIIGDEDENWKFRIECEECENFEN